MNGDPSAVPGHDPGQIQHLFLGPLRGIGIAEEVDALQLHAPLCHHITGNGAVDAAGQQQRRLSAYAHRQTAGAGLSGAMDKGALFPHLHIDGVVRMMHIHRHLGICLRQPSADFLRNLDGVQGKALVRPLGFHLKGLGAGDIIPQIVLAGGKNRVQILLAAPAPAPGNDAEHPAAGLPGPVQIAVLVFRFHIYRGLEQPNLKLAIGLQSPAQIAVELALKAGPVQPLQDDFTHFQEKHFIHVYFLVFLK